LVEINGNRYAKMGLTLICEKEYSPLEGRCFSSVGSDEKLRDVLEIESHKFIPYSELVLFNIHH